MKPLTAEQQKIVAENFGLVRRVVNKMVSRSPRLASFEEDLLQEGAIGLTLAVQKYQEKRGSFGAFAAAILKWHLNQLAWSWVHPTKAYRNKGAQESVPLEDLAGVLEIAAPLEDPQVTVFARQFSNSLLQRYSAAVRAAEVKPGPRLKPERDVEIFLRIVLGGENSQVLAKEYRLSKNIPASSVRRVDKVFQVMASEIREAA